MKRYKAHGVSPDTSNCLGYDGDCTCEKRKYCRRYTDGDYEHPINRLEYPGIYQSRCEYFTPNEDGLKKYFQKVGEWEL